MSKILSIVVPTYNMEQLLPRCINSMVISQVLDDIEILIVNDGSKDKSLDLACNYAKLYPYSVYAIDKENGNYGSAVNKGIELATGKYFRILDADDFFDTETLIYFISKLKLLDADMVVTNYVRQHFGYKSQIKVTGVDYDKTYDFKSFNIHKKHLNANFVMHGITYRTAILKDNGIKLTEKISYTDTEYCFYPLPYIKRLYFVDCFLYQYQIGREGQTISLGAMKRSANHMRIIIDRMVDWMDLNEKRISPIVIGNMLSPFVHILEMYFAIYLCWGNEHENFTDLNALYCRVIKFEGLKPRLDSLNIGGVHYMKRFSDKHLYSNSYSFKFYYKSIYKLKDIIKKILALHQLV